MMEKVLDIKWRFPLNWLRFLIIAILILGVFFRFVNLDKKIYWGDEAMTSIWISGHRLGQVITNLCTGEIIKPEEFHQYQGIFPGKSLGDTIQSLAEDTPLLPPLYFAMVRVWVQFFGDSIAATRSFSAFISLLVFPCIYWLCMELFNSSLVGWMAIALTAVSPYHVLYAQEARPYILWVVTILISSACLLRAIRTHKTLDWAFYAISLSASLYTYIFSIMVAIGHGIYVLVIQGLRFNKTLIAYLWASFFGIVLFSPWLLMNTFTLGQIKQAKPGASLIDLTQRLLGIISRNFIDLGIDSSNSYAQAIPIFLPVFIILIIIGYSFYFLCQTTPKNIWLFVITLTGTILGITFLRDLITTSGALLITNRYLFPCYLDIQIAVAYLLIQKITFSKNLQQNLWQIIFLGLVLAGILSNAVSSQAEVWWNKGGPITKHELQIIQIVNQSKNPLVISDAGLWNILNLNSRLDAKARLQLFDYRLPTPARFHRFLDSQIVQYEDYSDVFLFRPSQAFLNQLITSKNCQIQSVYEGIWRFENNCLMN